MCRFADMEQRHPTGMLSNIQGLQRSIYPGWPLFKNLDCNLQYRGPLPRVCPCSFVHKDPINDTGGIFPCIHLRFHFPFPSGRVSFETYGVQATLPLGMGSKA